MRSDIISFLKRLEYTDNELLRGLEIVANTRNLTRIRGEVVEWKFLYHRKRDLLFFYIDRQYLKLLPDALGKAGWLYVPVWEPQISGLYFYFAPWGYAKVAAHKLGWWWRMPAFYLFKMGYLKHEPGTVLGLLWPLKIRFRKVARPSA